MPEELSLPLNALEVALIEASRGDIPLMAFLEVFLHSIVAVPSGTEVLPDGAGMTPAFFDKQGTQMMVVFTNPERGKHLSPLAPYCLTMSGRDLLTRLPPAYGIVINPGYSIGFDVSPAGIREILRDFPVGELER